MTLDVLAIRARGLGDLLTAVPALRALREELGADVTVAAPSPLAPLVRLTGCHHLPAQPLQQLPPQARGARVVVNLHDGGPESHAIALATLPERLIAFHHPEIAQTHDAPRWRDGEHEVDRWCRLLTESEIPADPARLELRVPPLPRRLEHVHGATVVHPGAGSAARCWPAERFAAVAAVEAARHRRVVVTGSVAERPLARAIAERAGLPERCVLAGRTGLGALAAVIAHAGRVICGDTGVAHLATAFGVPSIVLFGPTSPWTEGPPPDRSRHRVLWAGQTGDPHAGHPHAGLLDIETTDVLAELGRLGAERHEPLFSSP